MPNAGYQPLKERDRVGSCLEFETMWAFGAMTGIDDLDTLARLDFMCDDIGVDTIPLIFKPFIF